MTTRMERIKLWTMLAVFVASIGFATVNVVWDRGSKFGLLCLVFGTYTSGRWLVRNSRRLVARWTAERGQEQSSEVPR